MKGKVLGIIGLIPAFVGKKKFSGSCDEDLDNTILILETIGNIFEVDDKEKLRAMLLLLTGKALRYFCAHVKRCSH